MYRMLLSLAHCLYTPVMYAASQNSKMWSFFLGFHYGTVDNAIKLIKLAGKDMWLSKADITNAFKIVTVHPSQWNLFGISWDSKYYFAARLTFGCKSSPSVFNLVSEALCWILLNRVRIPSILHLLDDFLLIDTLMIVQACLCPNLNTACVPLSDENT